MFRQGLTGLLLLAAGPAASTEPPLRVTTDSSAYCQELAARLAAQPRGGAEPSLSLGVDGKKLCETGHVRLGIAKLRRALRAAQLER